MAKVDRSAFLSESELGNLSLLYILEENTP